jgi:F0F1-type ATP synthase assembly protein I
MSQMEERSMTQAAHASRQDQDAGFVDFGTLIAMGISLGAALGLIFDELAMGSSLGLLVAVVAQLVRELKQGKRGAGVGLVIAVAGLLIVLSIWLLI